MFCNLPHPIYTTISTMTSMDPLFTTIGDVLTVFLFLVLCQCSLTSSAVWNMIYCCLQQPFQIQPKLQSQMLDTKTSIQTYLMIVLSKEFTLFSIFTYTKKNSTVHSTILESNCFMCEFCPPISQEKRITFYTFKMFLIVPVEMHSRKRQN